MSLVKKTKHAISNQTVSMSYWVETPHTVSKKMPLLVFLHGSGGHAPLNQMTEEDGKFELNTFVESSYAYPFIVIQPILPTNDTGKYAVRGWIGVADLVMEAINQTVAQFDIDEDRIYLSGFSMGGRGTWDVASLYPDRFAALMPAGWHSSVETACKVTHIPVWSFNGIMDQSCNFYGAERVVNAFREAGGDINFTIYHGGHVFEADTLSEGNLRWLLSHNKADNATRNAQKKLEQTQLKYKMEHAPSYLVYFGRLSAWDQVTAVKLENDSFSAEFKVMHDESNLYVFVEVSGASFGLNAKDSIEIFVDFNNKKSPIYDLQCAHYMITADNEQLNAMPFEKLKEVGSKVSILDLTTIFEVAIPFRKEAVSANAIGFDLYVNQYDENDNRSLLAWSDQENQAWFNPEAFGSIYF